MHRMNKFPKSSKSMSAPLMTIKTGTNHTIGLSFSRIAYTWGYNNLNNRMGIENKDNQKSAMIQMMRITALIDYITDR